MKARKGDPHTVNHTIIEPFLYYSTKMYLLEFYSVDFDGRVPNPNTALPIIPKEVVIHLTAKLLTLTCAHCSYLDISISPKFSEKSDYFPELTLAQYNLKK